MAHLNDRNLQFVFSSHYKNKRLSTALEAIGGDFFRKYTGRVWSTDNIHYHGTYEIPETAEKLVQNFINGDEAQVMAYLAASHGMKYELLGHDVYSNKVNNRELPTILNVLKRPFDEPPEGDLPEDFGHEFTVHYTMFPYIEISSAEEMDASDPDYDPDIPKRVERVTYLAAHPNMNKADFAPFTPLNKEKNTFYTELYDFFHTPVVGEEITVYDEKGFPQVVQPNLKEFIEEIVNFRPDEKYDDYNFSIEVPMDLYSHKILMEVGKITEVTPPNIDQVQEIPNMFHIDEIDRYNYFLDDYEFLIATNPEIPETVLPNIYLTSLVATDNIQSSDLEEIVYDDEGNPYPNVDTYKNSNTDFDKFITLDGFIEAVENVSKTTMKEYYKQYSQNYNKVSLDFKNSQAMVAYWTSINMLSYDSGALHNTGINTIPYYTLFRWPRRIETGTAEDIKTGVVGGHLWPKIWKSLFGSGGSAYEHVGLWEGLETSLLGDFMTSFIAILIQKIANKAEFSANLENLEFSQEEIDNLEDYEQHVHIQGMLEGSEPDVPHYVVHHGPKMYKNNNVVHDVIREWNFTSPVFSDWLDENTIYSMLEYSTDDPEFGVPFMFPDIF